MQKEQIDRFVTLAGLEMPALISPGKFQGAEIYEDSAVLTFLLPKVYPLEGKHSINSPFHSKNVILLL